MLRRIGAGDSYPEVPGDEMSHEGGLDRGRPIHANIVPDAEMQPTQVPGGPRM
jgi:hypothetical protein